MANLPSPVKKTRPAGQSSIRELASKYFPGLEDKILYLINGESGGDPTIPGDGGAAYGLFQSHYVGKGSTAEDQFKDARRLYDARVAAGGNGFEDWGENNLYEGKPFGALGNHPYTGGPQGQTVAGPAGTMTNYGKEAPVADPTNPIAAAAQKLKGASVSIYGTPVGVGSSNPGAAKQAPPAYKPVSDYKPVGRYDADMLGYSAAEKAALDKLDAINDRIIQIDDSNPKRPVAYTIKYRDTKGNFYNDPRELPADAVLATDDTTGGPAEFKIIDPEATHYAVEAAQWHDNQVRLETLRKAGLTQSGDDAAKAYLESEKTKAAEADRKYNNFVTRIKDLQAVEDIPTSRAMSLAQALSAANTANEKRQFRGSPLATVTQGPQTDFSPQADSLRPTIGKAPDYYGVNPITPKPADSTTINGQSVFPPPDPSIQIPGVPLVPSSSEAPGDFNIPNPSPGMPQSPQPQIAPRPQSFTNPVANLSGRAR